VFLRHQSRICLVIIENEQQFIGKRWQFAFATPARFAPASAGRDPICIGLLLRRLVDRAAHGQQSIELSLGQAGEGFHLTLVTDKHPHRLAPFMAFLRTTYLIFY
jgi:hypothetical protein